MMKLLTKKISKKLNAQTGETITEVLVAALVISLGSILLATMINASTQIIRKAEIEFDGTVELKNASITGNAEALQEGSSLTVTGSDTEGKQYLPGFITIPAHN